jgi:RNA-directed DNA polymerase
MRERRAPGALDEGEMTAPAAVVLRWQDVADKGGIREWVDAEIKRVGLWDDGVPSGDAEKKTYKARREEERRVRKELYRSAWAAYKQAHIVHLGAGVFWHDTNDVDRFDAGDPEKKRLDNALPDLGRHAGDVDALAKALGLTIPRIRWLAFHRDVDTGTHYIRWQVPKRDGSLRLISAPKPDLKRAQRWIAREVTEHLPVHAAAHGFVPGRSIVTNAQVHAGASAVVKLDIRGFYPTVTYRRVRGLLRRAGLGEQVATLMAALATDSPREEMLLRGKIHHVAIAPRSLPQGAPTSPSITNALCLRLDCRLTGLARMLGCRYTRYADDLTFSFHGDAARPAKKADGSRDPVGRLIKSVTAIVKAEGFTIHPKKTRVMRKGGRQKVTGLVVNAAPGRPPARVPRKTLRHLRAAIKNRELGRVGKGETLDQLRGMAAFVMMTDRERGRAFMARLDRLAAAARGEPTGGTTT